MPEGNPRCQALLEEKRRESNSGGYFRNYEGKRRGALYHRIPEEVKKGEQTWKIANLILTHFRGKMVSAGNDI